MTKKTSYRGTCAWCFASFKSTRDKVSQRHGWQEVGRGGFGGGRRVGEYGNVFHSGDCPGCTYSPYEVSAAGTKARLKVEQAQLAACEKYLAHLATRPPLVTTGRVYLRVRGKHGYMQTAKFPYQVKLQPGEKLEVQTGEASHERESFSYERTLQRRTLETEQEQRQLKHNIEFCEKKIAEWEPREMAEYAPRKQTVHYAARRGSYCGNQKSYGLATTENREEVTCSRCLKSLASDDARADAARETRELGDRIHAYLTENGPATRKQACDALGITTKAFNQAIDRREKWSAKVGEKYIGTVYEDRGPNKYEAGIQEAP